MATRYSVIFRRVDGAIVEELKSAGTDRLIEFDNEFDHVARMCFSMPSNLFVGTDVMSVTISVLPSNKVV
jgi:hypothetical protein